MIDGWEHIGQNTYRFPVPGGWLYRYDAGYDSRLPMAMVFVPDPEFYRHMDEEFQAMAEKLKRKTDS